MLGRHLGPQAIPHVDPATLAHSAKRTRRRAVLPIILIATEFLDENVQSVLAPDSWDAFRLREDDHSM